MGYHQLVFISLIASLVVPSSSVTLVLQDHHPTLVPHAFLDQVAHLIFASLLPDQPQIAVFDQCFNRVESTHLQTLLVIDFVIFLVFSCFAAISTSRSFLLPITDEVAVIVHLYLLILSFIPGFSMLVLPDLQRDAP